MEIGNEISQKLRTVIKTKLRELGSYVDDELPDYIMVMLANKRSKEQMTQDLVLFLGNNTALFTDWLVGIIQKLQEVTSLQENLEKSNEPLKAKDAELIRNQEPKLEKDNSPPKTSPKENRRSPPRTDRKEEQRTKTLKSTSHKKSEKQKSNSNVVKTIGLTSKSSVRKRKHSSSDEEDGRSSQLHSVVKVQERRPSLPPSKQAPSNLLKKAVAEAHLSVSKPLLPSSSLKYDPLSPPSPIRSHSYEEKQQQKELLLQQHRELRRQLLQMEQDSEEVDEKVDEESDGRGKERVGKQEGEKEEKKHEEEVSAGADQETSDTQEPEEPVIELQISEAEALEYSAELVEGDTRIVAFADSQAGGEDSEEERRRKRKKRRAVKSKKERPSSPKFIVTLDGVDSDLEDKYDDQVKSEKKKKKKAKKDETADDFEEIETSDIKTKNNPVADKIAGAMPVIQHITFNEDAVEDELEEDTSPLQDKLTEKCKFWPECKNGDECPFYHPTVTCRSFPSCRFGENCRFIHPPCKFDGRCANSSCPYTHKLKGKQQASPAPVAASGLMLPFPSFVAPPVPSGQPIPCKFFPACTKTDCPFYHPQPKPCRFGINCTRPNCVFSHPAKPSSLKWVSPSLHISDRRFAVSEQKVTSMPVS